MEEEVEEEEDDKGKKTLGLRTKLILTKEENLQENK